MKRFVSYILICFLIVSTIPNTAWALEAADSETVAEQQSMPGSAEIPAVEQQPDEVSVKAVEAPVVESPAVMMTVFDDVANKAPTTPPPDATINSEPSPIPANADVIISGIQLKAGRLQALELRSMSDKFINLANWNIDVVYSNGPDDTTTCRIPPAGYLYAKQYFTFVQTGQIILQDNDANVLHEIDFGCADTAGTLTSIEIYPAQRMPGQPPVERVNLKTDADGRWTRKETGSYRTGVFATDFIVATDKTRLFYVGDLYFPPLVNPLRITEIYPSPPICASSDTSLMCKKYVKVTNMGEDEINLAQYRLRSGSPLSSATTANTSTLDGLIAPGATVVLRQTDQGGGIYLAASGGTVWFQDRYGLQDYNTEVVPYSGAGNVGNQGLSWAYDEIDGQWKWSLPSPFLSRNDIRVPGEKVAKTTAVSSLMPCKNGQYRSEETNRCRTILLAGGTLVACKENQYRSEETNRCRSVVTASANLTPCKDNQYRSEETNRCRNIAASAIPNAAFAVTPVKETGKAFVGWWALGGVGLLAAGYGAWEWRREVVNGVRRVGSFFTSHK